MNKIKINKKEYTLKYTLRALFIYEKITKESFKFGLLINEYMLMYSTLMANNEDFEMSFDELIDICDKDNTIFEKFKKWLIKELEKQIQFQDKKEEKGDDKKKQKKK